MSSLVKGLFDKHQKVKGTVVLMQKNVLDINELTAAQSAGGVVDSFFDFVGDAAGTVADTATSLFRRSVALWLISATVADGKTGKGKVGEKTYLASVITSLPTLGDKQNAFSIEFEWDNDMGTPGAFYIENYLQGGEFFLVSLTLEDVPNHGTINFVCNSWVYNAKNYKTKRIFFANKTYLPSETPAPLVYYRQEELKTLRGDGTGERKEWERIYDYDVYNDLGDVDKNASLARPVVGGSSTLPYPRRGRTGRKAARKDPKSESRSDTVYLPRDESFGHTKSSDFLVHILKSASQNVIPRLRSIVTLQFHEPEFNTFEDVRSLYEGGIRLPTDILSELSPIPLFKELFRTDGEAALKFPPPKVIQVDHSAWMTDEEFAREMIAGVNPHIIKKLLEFPPKSKLDTQLFGNNTSTITKEHLQPNMVGVTVEQAIQNNKLFILDHHDPLFPYLRKINATETKAYATRTILFLQDDGTLKPLAIELSRPHPQGDSFGPVSKVYLPASEGVEASIWLLAKAYVIVNDSCYHQLVSHWLNTHAVVEPFVIATNRHLSVVHPIHKLLLPHYRDTMNINALARNVLVNAEGIIESTFLWGKYALEMSSVVYKDWVFTEQGLPNDLIKRGVAVEDPTSAYGLRLLIEDYPYASDGLEIWAAIKSWVDEYVNFYYKSDASIAQDSELQAFWKELVEVGHGDLKNATWWFKMQTREELIEACTTLIWIASALHAAVNFGQYPYGGYIVNRPTKSRRFMPEQGSPEYDELAKDYQKSYLRTITPKNDTLTDLTIIEVLSRHASDEQYLGERIEGDLWTSDSQPKESFKRFGKKLAEIEQKLIQRNNDETLRNRNGPVKMPYTLLYPSSEEGLTCRGIPNSVSI
ncbi:putative linoleate 9S-lipoxygenase [Medicago truncatula]|uniref:Lipoxygenase n=1 Tax=Medicago truncatula TaxID=3880 RepID=G7LIY2_MEDTR|nr:linoleate 9S-lipoxygenase [Medicago truncatula]AET01663.1 seed linoleate 9S-lipoxygenase [Medicago truncatula]RHN39360.1 putative linoleate 9S-lipoxygenase [Medicago truncatula]